MPNLGRALAALSLLSVAGCTITTHVDPIPPSTIPSLCIADNPKVYSKQFLPTMQAQLARRGIATTVYEGTPPAGCTMRIEWEAHWSWDMALYLEYADIKVYDGDVLVGRATYDARNAEATFAKFGRGDETLAKLLDQLLRDVNPGAAPAPVAASRTSSP
jgi:hypothetical protein